mgnify:CR=1 FL=1
MTQAAAFVGADELEVERASHPLVARATEAVFAAVAKGLAQSRGPTTTTTTAAAATGVRAGAGAAAGGGASADAGAGAGAGAGADAGGGGGHDNATTAAALEVAEADAGAGAVGPSTHGSSGGGLNQQQRRRIARMVREATTVTVVGSPLGLRLAPLVDTVGAVVAELQPGAAAETAGVEAGSVVVGVGSRRFHPATPYGVVRAAVREGSQAVSRGDVSGVVFRVLCQYMYTGCADFAVSEAPHVLAAASRYLLPGLQLLCESRLADAVTDDLLALPMAFEPTCQVCGHVFIFFFLFVLCVCAFHLPACGPRVWELGGGWRAPCLYCARARAHTRLLPLTFLLFSFV